jgi:hypothetical protein
VRERERERKWESKVVRAWLEQFRVLPLVLCIDYFSLELAQTNVQSLLNPVKYLTVVIDAQEKIS